MAERLRSSLPDGLDIDHDDGYLLMKFHFSVRVPPAPPTRQRTLARAKQRSPPEPLNKRFHDPAGLRDVTTAASLAHHGLLGSVKLYNLLLWNFDLSSIPSQQLVSLISRVTGFVSIENVSGCDLVTILDSVKSKILEINNQRLGREETQALVRAMETRVENLDLIGVNLDMEVMENYNLQGKCRVVTSTRTFGDRELPEVMRTLARRGIWKIVEVVPEYIKIVRK